MRHILEVIQLKYGNVVLHHCKMKYIEKVFRGYTLIFLHRIYFQLDGVDTEFDIHSG